MTAAVRGGPGEVDVWANLCPGTVSGGFAVSSLVSGCFAVRGLRGVKPGFWFPP